MQEILLETLMRITSMNRKKIEQAGILALKQLRLQTFQSGLPFMINSEDLPLDQCYFEFADGRIELVKMSRSKKDFETIKELTGSEQAELRQRLQLFYS